MLKAYLIAQLAVSAIIILFGVFNCIRSLLADQLFCSIMFAVMAYIAGYRLMFKTVVQELKENKKRV